MLMDFQMEGGQAIAAEIMADMEDLPKGYRTPTHEIRTFELPGPVWITMFGAYTVLYFGLAAVLNNLTAAERKALPSADSTGGIRTQTGWMDFTAAYAQILTVPILLAVFACTFAMIRALVR